MTKCLCKIVFCVSLIVILVFATCSNISAKQSECDDSCNKAYGFYKKGRFNDAYKHYEHAYKCHQSRKNKSRMIFMQIKMAECLFQMGKVIPAINILKMVEKQVTKDKITSIYVKAQMCYYLLLNNQYEQAFIYARSALVYQFTETNKDYIRICGYGLYSGEQIYNNRKMNENEIADMTKMYSVFSGQIDDLFSKHYLVSSDDGNE